MAVLTYRLVQGSNLSATQFDDNTHNLDDRLVVLEALPSAAAGIASATLVGDQLTFVMDDATTRGPVTLPVFVPTFSGAWAPTTVYSRGDIITAPNGSTYVVTLDHTSEASFDPGETTTDGDYYGLLLTSPDGVLPAGGAAGQSLRKSSATDYAVFWGSVYPSGGDAGTYLGKLSSTTDDVGWITIVAPPTSRTTISASTLTLDNGYMGSYIRFTNATSCTVTIPTNAADTLLTLNAEITLHQAGAGYVEIVADGGVTLNVPDGFVAQLYGLHATATLKKVQLNEWDLMGLLQPA